MHAINSLLAATDFSRQGGYAVQRAALLAAELGARLELLHVIDAASLDALRAIFPSVVDAPDRLLGDLGRLLDAQAGDTPQRGRDITTRVAVGRAVHEIADAAQNVDLLVLGARGTNRLRDLIVGTTAERLVGKSARPLLVVKRAPKAAYRRVLVGVDFLPDSVQALTTAAVVAPGAEITAVHALDVPLESSLYLASLNEEDLRRYRREARSDASGRLRQLVRGVRPEKQSIDARVQLGSVPNVVLRLAGDIAAELIMLGKHGGSALEDNLLGSTVRHVLASSSCDVLVDRARPEHAGARDKR